MTDSTNVNPPPPPVSPAPMAPMPMPPAQKPQGFAVASLVLGIAGCTLVLNVCFVPSILAIVFGSMALNRVRDGTGGGEGMARTGRICGIVSLIVYLMLVLLWVLAGLFFFTSAQRVGPNV